MEKEKHFSTNFVKSLKLHGVLYIMWCTLDDVYIISYWNDERPSNGLHTVAFKVTDDLRGEKVLRALNVRAGSGTYGGFDIFVKNEMGSNEKQFIVLYKLTQV